MTTRHGVGLGNFDRNIPDFKAVGGSLFSKKTLWLEKDSSLLETSLPQIANKISLQLQIPIISYDTGRILPTPTQYLDQELFESHRERLGLGEADDHWKEPQENVQFERLFLNGMCSKYNHQHSISNIVCVCVYVYNHVYICI